MKKQVTKWIWVSLAAENTGIRVGYIHNKSSGNREDVIRVEIQSKTCEVEFRCRLDEAVALAAGLNKVSAQMLWGMLKIPRPKRRNRCNSLQQPKECNS